MVHISTRTLIVRRENKTSTLRTARNMYKRFKNVTTKQITVRTARKMVPRLKIFISIRSTRNNIRTVTRRITKKRSSGRNKSMAEKQKILMLLKRYITTSYFLAMMHSHAKIKQSTRKLSKYSSLTQDIRHILQIAWKYEKPTRSKKSSQDRKPENNDGLALMQLEGIP